MLGYILMVFLYTNKIVNGHEEIKSSMRLSHISSFVSKFEEECRVRNPLMPDLYPIFSSQNGKMKYENINKRNTKVKKSYNEASLENKPIDASISKNQPRLNKIQEYITALLKSKKCASVLRPIVARWTLIPILSNLKSLQLMIMLAINGIFQLSIEKFD